MSLICHDSIAVCKKLILKKTHRVKHAKILNYLKKKAFED